MSPITKESLQSANHQPHLKIRLSIYEKLPKWYRACADVLALQGRVEIVADEVYEQEVR